MASTRMWQEQSNQEFSQAFDKFDKFLDSQSGDSGIFSCSSSATMSSNSDFSSCSIALEPESQPNSIDSMKGLDSGIDSGLSNSLNQLSLKYDSLNYLDANVKKHQTISKVACEEKAVASEKVCQEPWQLYFTQNEDGDTLLHSAIIQGYLEATLTLIDAAPHPCLLDIQNYDQQTALHLAVITNQSRVVRKLVLASSNLGVRNHTGNTALHLACMAGNLDCAKAITDHIQPQVLEQRNYNGETSLHVAVSKGHLELVKLLILQGADLEAREMLGGRTPLHLALEHNRLNIVMFLISECRPNLEAVTYAGYTPYQIASCIDKRWACELARYGATPTLNDDFEDDINDHRSTHSFSAIGRNATALHA